MPWYHVNYDLKKGDDEDYEDLFKAIKKSEAYSHVLKSGWVIYSKKQASEIRDELVNSTSKSIDILITRMDGCDAAQLKPTKIKYLVENLSWKSS